MGVAARVGEDGERVVVAPVRIAKEEAMVWRRALRRFVVDGLVLGSWDGVRWGRLVGGWDQEWAC